MKTLSILAAALAIPAGIAAAQTPTLTSGQAPYIPLFSSGGTGATGGTTGAGGGGSTWYIDTARNLVVLCSAASAQSFTCTAQPVPTSASTGASSGGGTPGAGAGAAGAGAAGGGAPSGTSGPAGTGAPSGAGASPM